MAELRNGEHSEDISKESREDLISIGRSLHSYLLPPKNHELYSKSAVAYAGGQSIAQLEGKDDSNLRALIHGISTGLELKPADESKDSIEQRTYNQTYTAADIVRTAKRGGTRGSKLKDYISDSLNLSAVPDRVKSLLNSIGISRGRKNLKSNPANPTSLLI